MFAKVFAAGLALAAVAAVAEPSIAAVAVPAGAGFPWEAFRARNYLRLYAWANNFSGDIYLSRNGYLLARRPFGLADADSNISNGLNTRFHVAGLTRMYTAAAILLLEQDGKLSTADPVSRFLPGEPGGERSIGELARGDASADYDALASIVEKASGERFADFMRAYVFAPLNLQDTYVDTGASDPDRTAMGTEPVGLHELRNLTYDGWSKNPGSQAIVATAQDVCAFADGLWKGRLLNAASLAKITASVRDGGLGWIARERGGRPAVGGGGHGPGFGASLDYFPDSGTCVAILTNIDTWAAQVVAPDIDTIALGSSVHWPDMGYEPPEPGALEKFAGAYRMPADFVVPSETVTLTVHDTYLEANWSGGIKTVIYPTTGDDFVDRNAWARVHFTRNTAGAITGFDYKVLRSFTAQRIQ